MSNIKEVVFKNRSSLSDIPGNSPSNTPRSSITIPGNDFPSNTPRNSTGTTPSRQDLLTEEDIKSKLKNYKRIRNIPELKDVKPSTWVKYFNTDKKLFRVGGVLTNNGYPDFFILKNPYNKKSWSVQLKDNVFFVPDNSKIEKEKAIKEELHRLYKGGMLKFSKTP
jgi:hypothetical protein